MKLRTVKIVAGFYKVFGADAFANVKRNRETRQWEVDIRNNSGDLIQYAGIWDTKKDAVEEAQFVLSRI